MNYLKKVMFFFVSLSILIFSLVIISASSTTIFSDGFESGLGNWTAQNGADITTNASYTYGGVGQSVLFKDAVVGNELIFSNTISTVGYKNIVVSYDLMTAGLEVGDSFDLKYSLDGGATNTTAQSNNTNFAYSSFSFNLNATANNNSNVMLEFSLTADDADDIVALDNVVVNGTDALPPVISNINRVPLYPDYEEVNISANVTDALSVISSVSLMCTSPQASWTKFNVPLQSGNIYALVLAPGSMNNDRLDNVAVSCQFNATDGESNSILSSLFGFTYDLLPPIGSLVASSPVYEGTSNNYNASASSDAVDTSLDYAWDWNYNGVTFVASGNINSSQNHTYNDNGTYVSAVRVMDNVGHINITTKTINVTDVNPIAVAGANQVTIENVNVNFNGNVSTGNPSDDITLYQWDFSYDGVTFNIESSSASSTASHVYLSNGNYTVALRVKDEDSYSPINNLTVNVTDVFPTANFTSNYPKDEGQVMTFTDTSTSSPDTISLWSWDFGDGSPISNLTNPTHTYVANGTYTVTLTVTDSDGSTNTKVNNSIFVGDLSPTANFNSDSSKNEGQVMTFMDLSTKGFNDSITNWNWNFGDGSANSSSTNPTHIFNASGTYTVTLTVTDSDGSTNTKTNPVTVNDLAPTASFTSSSPRNESQIMNFTDTSTSSPDTIASWNWSFGDGANSSSNLFGNSSHIYANNGTYTVTLTVTDSDGSPNTKTASVTVNDLSPTANFTSNSPRNESQIMNFTDTSTSSPDTIASWNWSFGDGANSSSNLFGNSSHIYANNGTYTVTLTVTDSDGSPNTKTASVTVNDLGPSANFTSNSPKNEGQVMTFTDNSTSSPDTIKNWSWNFGDSSTSALQNTTHIYANNGTYTVTLNVTDSDGSTNTKTANVTVNDLSPIVSFTSNPSVNENQQINFTDTTIFAYVKHDLIANWNWNFGDSSNSSLQNASHIYANNGTYTVTLTVTDSDGSVNSSSSTVIVLNVAPIFTNLANSTSTAVKLPFTYDVDTSDVPADTLTYAVINAPVGLSINSSSGLVSWTPNSTQRGDYTVNISVNDGSVTVYNTLTINVYDYKINLVKNWNLISVPLVPTNDNTSVSNILSSVSGSYNAIWSYQNGSWKVYQQGGPTSLTTIVPGLGYYINMTSNSVLYNNGNKVYGTGIFQPPVVTLTPSWNLIGHYGINNGVNKSDALKTVDGNYATLLNINGNSASSLNSGEGYWLFVTSSTNKDYAPSDVDYTF